MYTPITNIAILKNELILARRVGRYHQQAQSELNTLLQEAGLLGSNDEQLEYSPWLIKELPRLIAQRDEVKPEHEVKVYSSDQATEN